MKRKTALKNQSSACGTAWAPKTQGNRNHLLFFTKADLMPTYNMYVKSETQGPDKPH